MRDESSARTGEPVRIVIDVKRDADPEFVLNQLYQFSPLQKTVSLIMIALVGGQPRTLTIKQLLEEYLRHRVQVIRRRTEYLLREAKRRSHLLEGQLLALSSLDEVIRICRTAPSREEAKAQLVRLLIGADLLRRSLGDEAVTALQRELGDLDEYYLSEVQAEAIIRMQLGQLAALERDHILTEFRDIRHEIGRYEE